MKLTMSFKTLVFVFCGLVWCGANEIHSSSTSLIKDKPDNELLLLSTLDGSLFGVNSYDGRVRWRLKDEPVVKVPIDASKTLMPLFLPDPKDGSLYVLSGSDIEALKKLPFTIPQLVASSPCLSSDGILYSGKKLDTWFSVDTKTGQKKSILSFDRGEYICPVSESENDAFYIGRTEYNIVMLDSKKKERRWNVTFFDYSASAMDEELLTNYEMIHFMGSSSGRMLTMDRRQHSHLWSNDYGSPVIGVYILGSNGLISCPFTTVAEETLDVLTDQIKSVAPSHRYDADQFKLKATLYVGEHPHGLYALPSLVDSSVATIERLKSGPLLLEGPHNSALPSSTPGVGGSPPASPSSLDEILKQEPSSAYPVLIFGHYQMPSYSKTQMQINKGSALIPIPKLIGQSWDPENESEPSGSYDGSSSRDKFKSAIEPRQQSVYTQTDSEIKRKRITVCWEEILSGNISSVFSSECIECFYTGTKLWITQQENKSIKVLMALIIISMAALFCYVRGQMREFHQLSHSSRSGSGSQTESVMGMTAQAVEADGGGVQVGKILFYTDQVLGKGCEGTFVYRGLFDGRRVAVKRLLPECFSLADREVALLRESDQHANVVRYFCTEQDRLFRYIALELAATTLADLVEGEAALPGHLTSTDILRQATSGLAHLHSLDIVHRDIKPQNVLLSMPNVHGEVRAMISDFGLCKKLQKGRISFSRRSGVAGTDGWIAPEMLNGSGRTTCAVDIFSMGCVFYYVKTNGKHPFGDTLRRQANILSGEFKLTGLNGSQADQLLTSALVERMLSWEPLERPPAKAVLSHPLFWNEAKIMAFFQDVSDRVEKDEQETSPVLENLEKDGKRVVRGDWTRYICDDVAEDLRRYRSYRGDKVRDLLRALRNKKNHYRELSVSAQRSLGVIPEQFILYWMNRFPRLLLHSWLALQMVRHEPVFKPYYHAKHIFASTQIEIEADSDWKTIFTLDETDELNLAAMQDSPFITKKDLSIRKKQDAKRNSKTGNWRDQHKQQESREINLNKDKGSPLWRQREKHYISVNEHSPIRRNNLDQENWRSPGRSPEKTDRHTSSAVDQFEPNKRDANNKNRSPLKRRNKKQTWKNLEIDETQVQLPTSVVVD